MVISIVANLYYTDTCNQTPPPNMPGTGNEKDTNHQFFYFYNSMHDLTSDMLLNSQLKDKRNPKNMHIHKAYTATIQ